MTGRAIAGHYLCGFFWLDLASVVPLWILPFAEGAMCTDPGASTAALTGIPRLARLIRLSRLVKVSRVLRRRLQDILMNSLGATYAVLKLWQLGIVLLTSVPSGTHERMHPPNCMQSMHSSCC